MAPYLVLSLILFNALSSFGLRNDAGAALSDEISTDTIGMEEDMASEGENDVGEAKQMKSEIGTEVDPCTCALDQPIKFRVASTQVMGTTKQKDSCEWDNGYFLMVQQEDLDPQKVKGQDILWCTLTENAHGTSNIGITPGSKIQLWDLREDVYNGLTGVVEAFDPARNPAPGRYIVKLDNIQAEERTLSSLGINKNFVAIKPPNIKVLQEAEIRPITEQIAEGPPCQDWGCYEVSEEGWNFAAGKSCNDPGVHCVGSEKPSTIEGCAYVCSIHDKCKGFQSPNPENGFHGWCMWFEVVPNKAGGGFQGGPSDVTYVKTE